MPTHTDHHATVEPLTFSCDGLQLQGFLHRPACVRPPLVIGCHGMLSSSQSPKQQDLARACTARGMAFFRFDFRGCGASAGKLANGMELEARCRDLLSAAAMLRLRPDLDSRRMALFGSSFGGTVVLATAAALAVQAVVVFAAPLRNQSISTAAAASIEQTHPDVPAGFRLPPFDISARLPRLQQVLVVHGTADDVVAPAAAQEIFERVSPPREMVLQEDGDHLMNDIHHQQAFMQKTIEWFSHSLNPDF